MTDAKQVCTTCDGLGGSGSCYECGGTGRTPSVSPSAEARELVTALRIFAGEMYGEVAYEDERELCLEAAAFIERTAAPGVTEGALFAALAHGDDAHREWLRAAIAATFSGQPAPAPYGQGLTERYRKALDYELRLSTKERGIIERSNGRVDPLTTMMDRRIERLTAALAACADEGKDGAR
jgi:hypothetical protein